MQVCLAISGIDPPCAITPNTVSFATRAASSVSMAIWIARANASLSLFALNRAFRTASLLTEQIKRVGRASSRGFVIQKIPRTSVLTDTCCKLLELSHRFRASSYSRTSTVHKRPDGYVLQTLGIVSPGPRFILLQNFNRSQTTKRLGSNWSVMKASISSIVKSMTRLGGAL